MPISVNLSQLPTLKNENVSHKSLDFWLYLWQQEALAPVGCFPHGDSGVVKVLVSTQDTAVPSMFPLSVSLSAGHPGAQQLSRLLVGPCGHLNVPPMELMFVLLSLKLKWGGPNNNWDRKALGFHFSEFLHLGLMILSKSQLPLQGCFFSSEMHAETPALPNVWAVIRIRL